MNSQIYIVESAKEPTSVSTQQGTMMVQTVKLRELTGNNSFSQRWIVENLSGTDVRDMVGKPIGCCIENYVSGKDDREWNNLRIREVIKINTDTGAF